MEERVDVTMIGGGPCGLFAAFYAGMRGMSTRIIDSLPELGGQLTALYPEKYVFDMPGFPKVLAKDLAKSCAEQAIQFGARLALGETAERLEKNAEGYTLHTTSGKAFQTRTVVISAGAGAFSPTRLGVEKEEHFEGSGLYYGVRDRSIFAGKRLAIIGGGDSAFDWAINLMPIAGAITLIHRRDQFRAHEDSVKQVRESDANMLLWWTVKELHGDDRLTAITIENSQTKERDRLDIDALIVNVGFKSSLGPIKTWGLDIEKNQILVNRHYETNLPGVFAVGDVCNYEGKLRLIATGVSEATIAVCYAKMYIDPEAKLFPGHSSEMDLFSNP
jgi:thioredoxin reductase (NADPH)